MEPDEMRCYVRFLLGRLEEKLDQMNCILNDLTEIKTEFKNSSHEQRQLLNRMRVQADELDRLRKANVELALSNKKSEDRFRLFLLISFLWVALLLFIWVLTVKALRIKKPYWIPLSNIHVSVLNFLREQ